MSAHRDAPAGLAHPEPDDLEEHVRGAVQRALAEHGRHGLAGRGDGLRRRGVGDEPPEARRGEQRKNAFARSPGAPPPARRGRSRTTRARDVEREAERPERAERRADERGALEPERVERRLELGDGVRRSERPEYEYGSLVPKPGRSSANARRSARCASSGAQVAPDMPLPCTNTTGSPGPDSCGMVTPGRRASGGGVPRPRRSGRTGDARRRRTCLTAGQEHAVNDPAGPRETSGADPDPEPGSEIAQRSVNRESRPRRRARALRRGARRPGRGEPACLAVEGEPGIGKTRLLAELRRRAERSGAHRAPGAAAEFERDLPYGVWVEALDAFVASQRLTERRVADLAVALPSLEAEHAPATAATGCIGRSGGC